MGMKEITLPKELKNLPQPWGQTDFTQRDKQLEKLSYTTNEIKTALNVLERCLHTLWLLTPPSGDSIPEPLMEYWGFTAQWLAEEMPTLDQLRMHKVERKLKEYGIESPSPNMIRDVAEYWVWWLTHDIEEAALYWVEDALITTREPILTSRFLHIVSRYWQKIEPRFAQSLLRRCAMIGWQRALPLFERVEQNPKASEAVKETVRNYREFVLIIPTNGCPILL